MHFLLAATQNRVSLVECYMVVKISQQKATCVGSYARYPASNCVAGGCRVGHRGYGNRNRRGRNSRLLFS